jgi:hypothetical protein
MTQGVKVSANRVQMYIERSVADRMDVFGRITYTVTCYTGVAHLRTQEPRDTLWPQCSRVKWIGCQPPLLHEGSSLQWMLAVSRPITRLPKRNGPPRTVFQPTPADIAERSRVVLDTRAYTRVLAAGQFAAMQHVPLIATYAAYLRKQSVMQRYGRTMSAISGREPWV